MRNAIEFRVRADARASRLARLCAAAGVENVEVEQLVDRVNEGARVVDLETVRRCVEFERKHLPPAS